MQHTPKNIIIYLERLVLFRFTTLEFQEKIKSDFDLESFIIVEDDNEKLQDCDDSFIFSLRLKELSVDVTMYYISTNKKDTFIITELSYCFFEVQR